MYNRKKAEEEIKKVKQFMQDNAMAEPGDGIVVGVSGGADSVCLFLLLLFLKDYYQWKLTVVHVHHMIRGVQADEDMEFVKKLAAENDVECVVVKKDVQAYAKEHGMSEEEAGRMVRYEAFTRVREERGFQKIAVAHNGNDLSETVLFHLCRGTGLKGLTGIAPVRDEVIRPILCLSRQEVESFLEKVSQEYCTDATNLETTYTRNRIRHQVLPVLEREINRNTISHIASMAQGLREIEEYLADITGKVYEELVSGDERRLQIEIEAWQKEDPVIQKRLLRRMLEKMAGRLKDIHTSHIYALCQLCKGESGKQLSMPYEITAVKEYSYLALYRPDGREELQGNSSATTLTGKKGNLIFKKQGFGIRYHVKERSEVGLDLFPKNDCTKWFDYDKIKSTVLLRKPLASDFIQISRGGHNKKLGRFFIDEKIPRQMREETLVLAEGNHILWVPGRERISEAYKITETTKAILECIYYTLEE